MASWKVVLESVDANRIAYTSFANARKYFTVDASGSTAGTRFTAEHDFATGIHNDSLQKDKDTLTKWGSYCMDPTSWEQFMWAPDQGGTKPQWILKNQKSIEAIRKADIWFLLTDGEVPGFEVQALAGLGRDLGAFDCATVFLVVSNMRYGPNNANISVGITYYANCANALCLFKDYQSGEICIIASKGCFAALDQAEDHDTWEKLTSFPDEAALLQKIAELDIHVPTAETRVSASAQLNLGEEWNSAHGTSQPTLVDLDGLLRARVISDEDRALLLADESFDTLLLACKSRGKLHDLRSFLLAQRVEQSTPKLQDISGAAEIIAELSNSNISGETKTLLQSKLRGAHKTNRRAYITTQNDVFLQAIRDRNRGVDAALRAVAEAERTGFTAAILSRRSNRARRAEDVFGDSAIDVSVLDLEAPGYRGECQICCGDNEIMSIALKELSADAMAANTDNFTLDFPLAAGRIEANMNVLSSQCICFQCALLGRPGYSIYGEEITAVIPTLEHTGNNKLYIHQQLYKALNAGLKTGVPAMGQLFATILDRKLRGKKWAGSEVQEGDETMDPEVRQRRRAISWLLQSILTHLRAKETFNELGQWTTYPLALSWAARDFQQEGLTAWCINYPVAGFMQLLRFGKMLNVFSDKTITEMKNTKLLHSFVSTYFSRLYKNMGISRNWTKTLLEMLYVKFNDDLIPRDLGGNASILKSVPNFWNTLMEFMPAEEFFDNWTEEEITHMMPRIQALAFWLVYYQLAHTSTKTYFAQLRSKEPLAVVLLDTKAVVPENMVSEILLSIFIETKPVFKNKELYVSHQNVVIPFASPFGASVLHCGAPDCGTSFIPEGVTLKEIADEDFKWTASLLDRVRRKRRDHLVEIFGVLGGKEKEKERSETGLPGVTKIPERPCEVHACLHIGIAKTWAILTRENRRYLAGAVAASRGGDLDLDEVTEGIVQDFVEKVQKYICGTGRGNIFSAGIEKDIKVTLPSFIEALKMDLITQGKEKMNSDVSLFEFDFGRNNVEQKIKWEVEVLRRKGIFQG